MEHLYIPKSYQSQLSLYDTQVAIKTVKDFFQQSLAEQLYLLRVSAPLFVTPESKSKKSVRWRSSTLLQNGNAMP